MLGYVVNPSLTVTYGLRFEHEDGLREIDNQQTVTWFYGAEFAPTPINQEDVATARGAF